MAPYLFWELMILAVGVWLMAVLFFVYGFLLLRHQKQMIQTVLQAISPQMKDEFAFQPIISEEEESPKTISKNHLTTN